MSFLSLLTIVFLVLKLIDKIDWSWWLVILPSILHVIIFILSHVWIEYQKQQMLKDPVSWIRKNPGT